MKTDCKYILDSIKHFKDNNWYTYHIKMNGQNEPKIEFEDVCVGWGKTGYWDPPDSNPIFRNESLWLSDIFDFFEYDNELTDEEYDKYEEMFATKQFDEVFIKEMLEKYLDKSLDTYYNKHKEDYISKRVQEKLQDEYERMRDGDY